MYLNHKELSKYGSHGLQQCLKLKFFLKNFYQYQIKNRPTKTKYVLSFQLILRTWSLFPFFIESALKKAWKKLKKSTPKNVSYISGNGTF